jgi:hypothetical protein
LLCRGNGLKFDSALEFKLEIDYSRILTQFLTVWLQKDRIIEEIFEDLFEFLPELDSMMQ